MKLYYSAGACSLAPHILIQEAGLAHSLVPVNLKTKQYAGGEDFFKKNAKGYVPAIELDSGDVLTEGSVILTYIADQKPESGLMPKSGTMERYHALEWLNYVATEIHKGYTPLWDSTTPDGVRADVKERLVKRYELIDRRLQASPFLMGDRMTAPDAYLFTVTRWSHFLKLDLSRFSAVTAFMGRMRDLPSVQAAMKAEGLKG